MKTWSRRIGGELLTLLVILAVLETCSRLFAPAPPLATHHDPLVGARYPRSMSRRVYNPESKQPIWFRTNADGFRGPDWPRGRQPGIRRVAILGDSFIAAEGVEEKETLVNQLEDLLSAHSRPGQQWEVMNCGIAGSSTADQLALYRNVVREYHPDILVVGYGTASDVVDNSRELAAHVRVSFELTEEGQLSRETGGEETVPISEILLRWSRFYSWQKVRTNRLIKELRQRADQPSRIDWIFAGREPEKMQRAWELTAAILEQLDRETNQDGCQLVVMAIPCAIQVYSDSESELRERLPESSKFDPLHPSERLAGICQQGEIPCLLMARNFRHRAPARLSTRQEEWLFFNGIGHLNHAGHRAAAENLFEFLGSQPLWQR
jgi:lysophospholipase L1-like esterase